MADPPEPSTSAQVFILNAKVVQKLIKCIDLNMYNQNQMSNPNVNKFHLKNSKCTFKKNKVSVLPARSFRPELGGHRYQSAFATEHDYFMCMEQTGKMSHPTPPLINSSLF